MKTNPIKEKAAPTLIATTLALLSSFAGRDNSLLYIFSGPIYATGYTFSAIAVAAQVKKLIFRFRFDKQLIKDDINDFAYSPLKKSAALSDASYLTLILLFMAFSVFTSDKTLFFPFALMFTAFCFKPTTRVVFRADGIIYYIHDLMFTRAKVSDINIDLNKEVNTFIVEYEKGEKVKRDAFPATPDNAGSLMAFCSTIGANHHTAEALL